MEDFESNTYGKHAPLVQTYRVRVDDEDVDVVSYPSSLELIRRNREERNARAALDRKRRFVTIIVAGTLALGGYAGVHYLSKDASRGAETTDIVELAPERPDFDEIYSSENLVFEADVVGQTDGRHYKVVVTKDGEYTFIGPEGPFDFLDAVSAKEMAIRLGFDEPVLSGKQR